MINWNESEILVDRKSKFQARCCPIKNQNEIEPILSNLLALNKSVAKASHPYMYAWRTADIVTQNDSKNSNSNNKSNKSNKSNSKKTKDLILPTTYKNVQQGCTDGGESGAGQRLLTLLERSNVINAFVIVTRWYGGTPLGSARFRHISTTAVESLKKAKFLL
ncbi:hypothetical protein TPHA_0A03290 [Tetrapisispora phaffii CBS 4417]|uniref:Impact N-terminal domain-containing protein n=1 Tax=Tetrapisispora phaffii (strain ATCC 24235 / CBS 4417 / NBRC 1672 / NRRL Y-8282 / UCD 70-5) TaxID=1071381 RepID=G8BNC8_TETPH|nr:hypothetical protein TPHA_0A03290 [Tetrapisispora phaffii CBS 4417]CCE61406.1 hypothetical protein TPHA_0A03290 [Tetrapisispora phaffii CBS 4417]